MAGEVGKVQPVDQGHWEDGKFVSPEGWPEGAGWVVKNPDGSIAQWGPASDLALVVTTLIGDPEPLPPASQLSASFTGSPVPEPGDE
jgi:hypothetical protein